MSLLVARMITPLVAAYFLRSSGVQAHANWKWMDVYLKGPELEPRHVQGRRDVWRGLPRPARNFGYYFLGACLLLLIVRRFLRRHRGAR